MEIYSLNFKLQYHINHIRREPRSGMVTQRLWIMIKLKEREVGGERDCERERVRDNGKDTTWERRSWNYWGLEKPAFWLHRCTNKQPLNGLFRIKLWCRERKAFILGNANFIYGGMTWCDREWERTNTDHFYMKILPGFFHKRLHPSKTWKMAYIFLSPTSKLSSL